MFNINEIPLEQSAGSAELHASIIGTYGARRPLADYMSGAELGGPVSGDGLAVARAYGMDAMLERREIAARATDAAWAELAGVTL